MNSNFTLKNAAAYFLVMFVALLLVSLLLAGFYAPVYQYLQGEAVDFAAWWQAANFNSRLIMAFVIALLFTINKYRKERKKLDNGEIKKAK